MYYIIYSIIYQELFSDLLRNFYNVLSFKKVMLNPFEENGNNHRGSIMIVFHKLRKYNVSIHILVPLPAIIMS